MMTLSAEIQYKPLWKTFTYAIKKDFQDLRCRARAHAHKTLSALVAERMHIKRLQMIQTDLCWQARRLITWLASIFKSIPKNAKLFKAFLSILIEVYSLLHTVSMSFDQRAVKSRRRTLLKG